MICFCHPQKCHIQKNIAFFIIEERERDIKREENCHSILVGDSLKKRKS